MTLMSFVSTDNGRPALKGQKNDVLVKLLPFQGDSRTSRIPKALPWADISLALQAVLHKKSNRTGRKYFRMVENPYDDIRNKILSNKIAQDFANNV